MNNFDFIIKPVITEKATGAEAKGKYQFFIRNRSTKVDIKKAFEKLYGVKVVKVNVINTPEKNKLGKNRKQQIKKHSLKKIIITTKGKKTIDVLKPKIK
ncbi:MAG: 50S ribosomal protein L23 [Patescibacteria group bacterium]